MEIFEFCGSNLSFYALIDKTLPGPADADRFFETIKLEIRKFELQKILNFIQLYDTMSCYFI